MNRVTIKKIGAEELDTLLNFSKKVFFEAFSHLNKVEDMDSYATKAFTYSQLLSELSNPDSEFYFALLDNSLAGYLKLNYNTAQTEPHGNEAMEVERIYVDKAFQNKQIGQQLLDFVIEKAKELQLRQVWLGVWEHNQNAIRFYERNGFKKFSSHDFMLGSDKQTDLLLNRDL